MDLMSLVYASLIILCSKKSQTYSIQLSIEFIKEDLFLFVKIDISFHYLLLNLSIFIRVHLYYRILTISIIYFN
jgi:hypothetical protein